MLRRSILSASERDGLLALADANDTPHHARQQRPAPKL